MPKCDLPIDVYIYCTKEDSLCCIKRIDRDRYICGKDFDLRDFPHLSSGYDGKGKVVAKFTLNKVEKMIVDHKGYYAIRISNQVLLDQECWINKTCLTNVDLLNYLNGNIGYAWHISNLVIFDKPKELSEFVKCDNNHIRIGNCFIGFGGIPRLTKAPQSWQFIEVGE